ncbi:MAG: hypothetical protein Q7R65_00595, partial [bacterium]|nr:hypothetical protein [bacterium]
MPPDNSFDKVGFRYILRTAIFFALLIFAADFGVGRIATDILSKPYAALLPALDRQLSLHKDRQLSAALSALALERARENDVITLGFGGDVMLDRGVKSSINRNGGSFTFPFEKVAERLRQFDF